MLRNHTYDLFIWCSKGGEDIANTIVIDLWKEGVKYFWWDSLFVKLENEGTIPKISYDAVPEFRHVIAIITPDFLENAKTWIEDEYLALIKEDKIIFSICHNVSLGDIESSFPPLVDSVSFNWDGSSPVYAEIITRCLMDDKESMYFKDTDERREVHSYWSNILLYIYYLLDLVSQDFISKQFEGLDTFPEWYEHWREESSIDEDIIDDFIEKLYFIPNAEELAQAITLIKKAEAEKRGGWVPYFQGDEELLKRLFDYGVI